MPSASVDLPTPGSPPIKTSDPGTSPPPSTRSTSPIPRTTRGASSRDTSVIGVATAGGAAAAARPPTVPPPRDGAGTGSSTNVFHPPQPGQRPSHFADSYPQVWQTKTARPTGPVSLPRLATRRSLPDGIRCGPG